jgi:hypothetical protein
LRKALFLIACLLCFGLGSFSTIAVMQWTQRIPSSATVKAVGVGIYKDVNFTVSVTQIDWGIVEPGQSKNFSAYIVNRSNVPITLSMTTENWNPTNASKVITLTWNYSGTKIAVDDYVFVTFVLSVDQAISGIDAFSFTIVVTGSG